MGIKTAILCLAVVILFIPSPIFAHPGNTASDGCHYCRTNCDRWGVPWYERHCHGGYTEYVPYVPPPTPIPIPQFPQMNASWTFTYNADKSLNVDVTLDDSSPTQYSAVLNTCKGCDPGPNTDFTTKYFHFYNVYPGTKYLNVKKAIGGMWSTTVYYTVDVPVWASPTPTTEPTYTPLPTADVVSQDTGGKTFEYLALYSVLGIAGIAGAYKLFSKS